MTRRALIGSLAGWSHLAATEPAYALPVHIVFDIRIQDATAIERIWKPVWAQTIRDLTRGGIRLESSQGQGEVKRTASGAPVFTGLARGKLNVVVTPRMPINWDLGRGVSGIATIYEGHHLVVIPLDRAHMHQVPFLSVNTCIHEMLHVLLQDIYEKRPSGFTGEARELRVDVYATRLWLFGDSSVIRNAIRRYAPRLRSQSNGSE